MTEADLFRQYAKEAMRSSSKSINEDEKRNLDRPCLHLGASSADE